MGITSKTGLTASPTKKIQRNEMTKTVQLKAIARPAPFVLKPFAGLYNPYPHGCSLLCNHPTDNDAKELLRKAKDNWANEGKNILLAEEIEAIRAGLKHVNTSNHLLTPTNIILPQVESVPEELFRRYTETDSRPLTPAPTLASAATRASGSRRCVTPDPLPTSQIKEKTLLILDLRRSHSQETLSYYGSSSIQEPPLIRIQHVPTRTASLEELNPDAENSTKKVMYTSYFPATKKLKMIFKKMRKSLKWVQKVRMKKSLLEDVVKNGVKGDVIPQEAPPAFQASMDPETQVATIGIDSYNTSTRPSLVPGSSQDLPEVTEKKKGILRPSKSLDIDSYLDTEILKQLRRELNEEIVDNELNYKRRMALEEALKTVSKDKTDCEELVALQNELKISPINANLWISLQNSNAHTVLLKFPAMTPIDYVKENVSITSARKLLYNCIFNKFKMDADDDHVYERKLSGKSLQACLNLIMGKPMTQKQAKYFKDLIGWEESDIFDFKTCCGIFALCERLLAPEFCPRIPDRKTDPCHEIETADFEVLSRKLHGQKLDEKFINILNGIKTL
ncbi:hypothetical protein NQ314_021120 [Rhamnusium bicolor]|uniref:Uncharacterized protein n=1 Tax=Rhamnusium bicolor TaxID=1586634 RepID=A0AAV8WJM9_9CUCU|nr:hypothetical protein NQ314_021120 [Rhamnusium bicolor]